AQESVAKASATCLRQRSLRNSVKHCLTKRLARSERSPACNIERLADSVGHGAADHAQHRTLQRPCAQVTRYRAASYRPEIDHGDYANSCFHHIVKEGTTRVRLTQRIVPDIRTPVIALRTLGELHERIRRYESTNVLVVNSPVHVNEPKLVQHLVAGVAACERYILQGNLAPTGGPAPHLAPGGVPEPVPFL